MPEITDFEALFPCEALRRPALHLPSASLLCDASKPASSVAALVPCIPARDVEDCAGFVPLGAPHGLTRPMSCPDLELVPCVPEITDALLAASGALPMADVPSSDPMACASPAGADTDAKGTGSGGRVTRKPMSTDAAEDVNWEDVDSVDAVSLAFLAF